MKYEREIVEQGSMKLSKYTRDDSDNIFSISPYNFLDSLSQEDRDIFLDSQFKQTKYNNDNRNRNIRL